MLPTNFMNRRNRLPDLRLAEVRNEFRHLPVFVLRALNELHIDWTPAPL